MLTTPGGTLSVRFARTDVVEFLTVFGAMRDKDYRSMIDVLAPSSRMAIAVRAGLDRSLETRPIMEGFHSARCPAVDGGTVPDGMERARREVRAGETIVVTGSHYVVGELLKSLNFDV